MAKSLSWRHFLLALLVVAVWGSNFVVVKLALAEMPPLLFAALRFAAVVLPLVFLLPRPPVPWANLAAYGLLTGVGQFGLLFMAMDGHMSPGLASLVIQLQVFFTIALALTLAGEGLQPMQWLALLLAAAGLGLIVLHLGADSSVLGLLLVLLAALSWALANLVGRAAGRINTVAYVAWSSLFAVPPLAFLSFWFEGYAALRQALVHATGLTWLALLWQAWGNSIFGYAVWGWLLSRYSAAAITPMALLVPLFGMSCSAWLLGESLPAWKLGAAALVLAGLSLNLLWSAWRWPR